MRQAITTRYLAPTDTKDARIRATAYAGSLTVPWSDNLGVEENHQAAADALADKYSWRNPGNGKRYEYVGGGIPGPWAYAFVEIEMKGGK